jgi:hypothetical protein
MKEKFEAAFVISIVVVAFLSLIGGGIRAASTATISVGPMVNGAAPTESFSVNVTVADVADLYAWQLNLTFNPVILEAVSVSEGPFVQLFGTTMMSATTLNNTAGYVFAACALLDTTAPGASGSGVLATVSFKALASGTCSLHFSSETGLRTIEEGLPKPLPKVLVDGVFGYPRDLAVTGLVASSSSVVPGESVSLNATVENNGIVDEVFNVIFYRDLIAVGTATGVALDSGGSTWVVFAWDTTGVAAGSYTLRAEAGVVSGENDTENNVFSDGTFVVELVHDVAVTDLTVSPASVPSGGQVSINVTVFNKGSATESFSVSVSYGSTVIETKEVSALAPGDSEVLAFVWETRDAASGDYLLTATASTITGEINTEDNVYPNVSLEITNPPFTLSMEMILAIIAVVVVLIVAFFLVMKRRPKKT